MMGRSENEMLPDPERRYAEPGEPPLDESKPALTGAGAKEAARVLMDAAQHGTMVPDSAMPPGGEHGDWRLFQKPIWEYVGVPLWPRNGREAGAWCVGVMNDRRADAVVMFGVLKDHVDGAVSTLVGAGYQVQNVDRAAEHMTVGALAMADGRESLRVSRGPAE